MGSIRLARQERCRERMELNGHRSLRVRDGRGRVKLSGSILRRNHTYFKPNSRNFTQLPGSIEVTGTGSIDAPGEFRGEKSM